MLHYLKQSGVPASLHLKNIFSAMMMIDNSGEVFALNNLLDRLETRDQKIVSELSFRHTDMTADAAAGQALQCLKALETKNIEEQRAELRRKIRSAELAGNLQEALRLADELKR